jgi:glutathione S-transferase
MKILDFEVAPNPKRLRLFLAEKGIEVDIEQLDMLNRTLSECPYIAGQAFSIADITAYVAIELGSPSVFEIGPEASHVQRWYDETGSRASFRSLYSNW